MRYLRLKIKRRFWGKLFKNDNKKIILKNAEKTTSNVRINKKQHTNLACCFLYFKEKIYLYDFNSLFFQHFHPNIFQFIFLNFSASGHREFLDKENIFGDFMTGYLTATEVFHFFGS